MDVTKQILQYLTERNQHIESRSMLTFGAYCLIEENEKTVKAIREIIADAETQEDVESRR
jgi:hypothetical protein